MFFIFVACVPGYQNIRISGGYLEHKTYQVGSERISWSFHAEYKWPVRRHPFCDRSDTLCWPGHSPRSCFLLWLRFGGLENNIVMWKPEKLNNVYPFILYRDSNCPLNWVWVVGSTQSFHSSCLWSLGLKAFFLCQILDLIFHLIIH